MEEYTTELHILTEKCLDGLDCSLGSSVALAVIRSTGHVSYVPFRDEFLEMITRKV